MKFLDMTYRFELAIIDKNGNEVFSKKFLEFFDIRNWIKENYNSNELMEEAKGIVYCYNNDFEAVDFEMHLDSLEPMDDKTYEYYITNICSIDAECRLMAKEAPKIEFEPDYLRKELIEEDEENESVYACAHCIKPIDECQCKFHDYAISVDRPMLPIVKNLNYRGFKTMGCCCGHPRKSFKEGRNISYMYIKLDKKYTFTEKLPRPFRYTEGNLIIEAEYDFNSEEEGLKKRQELLDILEQWSNKIWNFNDLPLRNIESIKIFFKVNGIRIKSETKDYAIFGSMTSVGYRTDSDLNGIILYCYRDNEDLDRIIERLHKIPLPNSEKTRPSRIGVNENELFEIIEILKMNEKNL